MRTKKRNHQSLWLIPLLLLSGCNSASPERTTLRLVLSGLQQANEKTFFRTFVKLFEAEYGIDVEVIYENVQTLQTMIATETSNQTVTSDVIMIDTAHMHPFVAQNIMVNLDFLDDSYPKRTFTSFFDSYTHSDGIRQFAPVSFDIYLTMFHKDALAYIPDSVAIIRDENEAITQIEQITWQEIAQWAKAIKTATGKAKFGFPYGRVGSQLLYPIAGMATAFDQHAFPSFVDEGAIKAWNFLSDLYEDGALAFGSEYAVINQPTPLLTNENLWMSFAHMGPLGSAYVTNHTKYVLGPAPVDETSSIAGSTAGAWAFGIIEGTTNLVAAKKWIEFITTPEINYLYCSNLGGVISPIQEVTTHLGESATDKIMTIGLSMFSTNTNVIIVDTSMYTSWDEVKALYVDLYEELLSATTIDNAKLQHYQTLLDALKNPS